MKHSKESFAVILFALILAINVFHFTAVSEGWYQTHAWIDNPLHLLGGAFVGALFIYLFIVRHSAFRSNDIVPVFIAGLGFVTLIGVLWEFYEFFSDVYIFKLYAPLFAPRALHFDTLKDLLNDMIGGTIVLLALLPSNKKR